MLAIGGIKYPSLLHYKETLDLLFLFIRLKPRVERYTKSMSLGYEPALELLQIYLK